MEGQSLHEGERERHPRTEHRLLFDDMRESALYDTGTTKDFGNPDDSIVHLIGDEEKRKNKESCWRRNTGGR